MSKTHASVLASTLLCVCLAITGIRAQSPQEAGLISAIQRDPQQLSNYLDLAKLYAAERRYDDAERLLNKAIAALEEARVRPQPSATTYASPTVLNGQPVPFKPVAGSTLRSGTEPARTKYVEPVLPDIARTARVSGPVILEVTIGVDGRVTDAKILRGISLLNDAALRAVRQWEYTPTLLNGAPVSILMTVTVNFPPAE